MVSAQIALLYRRRSLVQRTMEPVKRTDDKYVGTVPGSYSCFPDPSKTGLNNDQLSYDQDFGPDKQLRQAVTYVVQQGILPFHQVDLKEKGLRYICWDCNVGGLFRQDSKKVKNQTAHGVISVGKGPKGPMEGMTVHKARDKRHKGKALKWMDMTGHEGLPIKQKIPLLKQMAAEMKEGDVTKPTSFMTGEDTELAEASAKHAALTKKLAIAKMKSANAAIEAELAALESDMQPNPTQHSMAESS